MNPLVFLIPALFGALVMFIVDRWEQVIDRLADFLDEPKCEPRPSYRGWMDEPRHVRVRPASHPVHGERKP